MILTGVNQKGILLEEQAEELWWKAARTLARVAPLGGTAIKRKMPAWSKRYGKT
jgi:hypothetical protein